ncbi:MAG: hypothetical protein ACPG61_18530 [Paracoccaceae bacterium]
MNIPHTHSPAIGPPTGYSAMGAASAGEAPALSPEPANRTSRRGQLPPARPSAGGFSGVLHLTGDILRAHARYERAALRVATLRSKVSRMAGRPGVVKARLRLTDALHELMAAEGAVRNG